MLTKGAIGNLVNRYKAVLAKCNLINTFGSLAVAAMLVMGGAGVASAAFTEITEPNQGTDTRVAYFSSGEITEVSISEDQGKHATADRIYGIAAQEGYNANVTGDVEITLTGTGAQRLAPFAPTVVTLPLEAMLI